MAKWSEEKMAKLWPDRGATEADPYDPRTVDECNTMRMYERDMRRRQKKLREERDPVQMEIAKMDEALK